MQTHITVTPVETYPGIWNVRKGNAQVTIPHGDVIWSETISTEDFGEDSATDFPGGFLPVHSWILAWAVKVSSMGAWLGLVEQFTQLKLRIDVQVAGGPSAPLDEYILPLTTGLLPIVASGERRIHALAAKIAISNNTGQSQVVAWDAWAKAG